MPRTEAATRHLQRALVERARGGHLDAFTELVKVYTPRLHGVANLSPHDIELSDPCQAPSSFTIRRVYEAMSMPPGTQLPRRGWKSAIRP